MRKRAAGLVAGAALTASIGIAPAAQAQSADSAGEADAAAVPSCLEVEVEWAGLGPGWYAHVTNSCTGSEAVTYDVKAVWVFTYDEEKEIDTGCEEVAPGETVTHFNIMFDHSFDRLELC